MSEATDSAVEAKEKSRAVALVIAILALLLALAEAGAKNAQHLSTEKNIESSDLFNFYQAKRIRSTVVETAAAALEAQKSAVTDPKAQEAFEQRRFPRPNRAMRKDPKKPEDSMDAIRIAPRRPRIRGGHRRPGHYEPRSGLTQIAIVWRPPPSSPRSLRSCGSASDWGRSARRSSPSAFSPRRC